MSKECFCCGAELVKGECPECDSGECEICFGDDGSLPDEDVFDPDFYEMDDEPDD